MGGQLPILSAFCLVPRNPWAFWGLRNEATEVASLGVVDSILSISTRNAMFYHVFTHRFTVHPDSVCNRSQIQTLTPVQLVEGVFVVDWTWVWTVSLGCSARFGRARCVAPRRPLGCFAVRTHVNLSGYPEKRVRFYLRRSTSPAPDLPPTEFGKTVHRGLTDSVDAPRNQR